jgi:hypothetical protein
MREMAIARRRHAGDFVRQYRRRGKVHVVCIGAGVDDGILRDHTGATGTVDHGDRGRQEPLLLKNFLHDARRAIDAAARALCDDHFHVLGRLPGCVDRSGRDSRAERSRPHGAG